MKNFAAFIKCLRPVREVSVGAVVWRRGPVGQPQFLLLRYPHGHWDFVKGHCEAGETEEETLRRELLEETGITGAEIMGGFYKSISFWYIARGSEVEKRVRLGRGLLIFKRVLFLCAKVKQTKVVLSDEHTDWAWLGADDAIAHLTYRNSREVLRAAVKKI